MTRAGLAAELDAVTASLALLTRSAACLALVVESLARDVRAPQDAPEREVDPATGMPVCTCPLCLAERERGTRP